jgi:hypothetical protein
MSEGGIAVIAFIASINVACANEYRSVGLALAKQIFAARQRFKVIAVFFERRLWPQSIASAPALFPWFAPAAQYSGDW